MTATSTNQDAVLRAFAAGNRGDIGEFLDCMEPDVEWRSGGIFFHPVQRWQGRDALGEVWRRNVKDRGGPTKVVVQELEEREDHVLAVGVASQRPVTVSGAWIFRMRDGRVAQVLGFGAIGGARAEWKRLRGSR